MLDKQRAEIDQIDRELVALFERRMAIVTEIGEIKKANSLPIFDEAREINVIERAEERLANSDYAPYVGQLFKNLMNVTKEYQKNIVKKREL
ncbi:MAG: chorismate mutase [Carnobacterium maltaromaticum]